MVKDYLIPMLITVVAVIVALYIKAAIDEASTTA